MAALIYSLCALTALLCTTLLLRAYRHSGSRFLMWSGLCFAILTLGNLLVVVDKLVLPMRDLSPWRMSLSVIAVGVLLYGLVFEER